MFHARCLPVLIGSLPLKDHTEALQLILEKCPEIPLWPQLPKNPKEGMIRQFLSGFPGLMDDGNNYRVSTDSDNFAAEMASFYEECMEIEAEPSRLASSRFSLGDDTAAGFFTFLHHFQQHAGSAVTLKGQVTGPVTTGIGVRDSNDRSIFYDESLREMLETHIALKARWQVEQLSPLCGKMPPLLFIDEPGLVSFGSSGFSGISEEMVTRSVSAVIQSIQAAGGLAGLHICANGDWGPPLKSAADIISFDAYFYFDNFILFRDPLVKFIERGGILAWGIVPTSDPLVVEQENVDSLFARWQAQVKTLAGFGFSEKQLMEQTLIAPSCGTGSLSIAMARKVLTMTGELSHRARTFLETL